VQFPHRAEIFWFQHPRDFCPAQGWRRKKEIPVALSGHVGKDQKPGVVKGMEAELKSFGGSTAARKINRRTNGPVRAVGATWWILSGIP